MNSMHLLRLELMQFFRNRSYMGLMFILLTLMLIAAWNTHHYLGIKKQEVEVQIKKVDENDSNLVAQIDSLNQGLATYESSYTLPTSGVRLTYNNHRVVTLPFKVFALIAIGQADLFSNYKKIVLYFNDSYEMSTEELVSPLEQLFGQLDLSFVWVYLLPLIIILTSFNVFSLEKETGRLSLIASQPVKLSSWVFSKLGIRFVIILFCIVSFLLLLMVIFRVDVVNDLLGLVQIVILLFVYSAFWFFLSFLINLAGFSSGKSLIMLTSAWVFFIFLIPTVVNLLAKDWIKVPSHLEVLNHHQKAYNEMESNLDWEMDKLYQLHPDWLSDDPATSDLTNSTGWNINYLAKQYIAQLKHQPVVDDYESQVDKRNTLTNRFAILSPALIAQSALSGLAGSSSEHYRSFLRQAQEYAHLYRQYVFKRLFTNHSFTSSEIADLPTFSFDHSEVRSVYWSHLLKLLLYLLVVITFSLVLTRKAMVIR